MKKLSLMQLSKDNLDKIQQRAVMGGDQCACICGYICSSCGCHTAEDMAVKKANDQGEQFAEGVAYGIAFVVSQGQ